MQHPVHYVIGSIANPPKAFGMWLKEPKELKISFGCFYVLFNAVLIYAIGNSLASLVMGAGFYLIMLCFLSAPYLIYSPERKDFFFRLSEAFINSTIVCHAYIWIYMIAVTVLSRAMDQLGVNIYQTTALIMSLSVMIFVMLALQMANAAHGKPGTWGILLYSSIFAITIYTSLSMTLKEALKSMGKFNM